MLCTTNIAPSTTTTTSSNYQYQLSNLYAAPKGFLPESHMLTMK